MAIDIFTLLTNINNNTVVFKFIQAVAPSSILKIFEDWAIFWKMTDELHIPISKAKLITTAKKTKNLQIFVTPKNLHITPVLGVTLPHFEGHSKNIRREMQKNYKLFRRVMKGVLVYLV